MVHDRGQQTFLNSSDYRTPGTDRIAALPSTGLEGRRVSDSRCWSELIARVAFTNLCRKHLDDEEAAYKELIDQGCPLMLADRAWNIYCERVAAGNVQ